MTFRVQCVCVCVCLCVLNAGQLHRSLSTVPFTVSIKNTLLQLHLQSIPLHKDPQIQTEALKPVQRHNLPLCKVTVMGGGSTQKPGLSGGHKNIWFYINNDTFTATDSKELEAQSCIQTQTEWYRIHSCIHTRTHACTRIHTRVQTHPHSHTSAHGNSHWHFWTEAHFNCQT